MMSFLYKMLPPPRDGENGDATTHIWKVAPGPGAQHWDMCREKGCIVVQWLSDTDLREFADKNAVGKALQEAGEAAANASAIWSFTDTMQPGDIIVANKGAKTVVGIGVVMSDYIAPHDPANPSADPEYCHAREIDWRVTEAIDVPFQFARRP
jgi:predicted Mrr-cat superfamily restriction endonuclease